MKTSKPTPWTRLACGLAGALLWLANPAHAAGASAEFKLDTPIALTDGTSAPAGVASVGQWLEDNWFYLSLSTFDERRPETYRGVNLASDQAPAAARAGLPFGEASISLPGAPGHTTSAEAGLSPDRLRVATGFERATDFSSASARWSRAFALNPHSEVTLSGIASLGSGLPAAPPRAEYVVDPLSSPYVNAAHVMYRAPESAWQDTGVFNTIDFEANILSWNPVTFDPVERSATAEDFSFSEGPDGRLSLTLRNVSDEVLFANFSVSGASEFANPVPEPGSAILLTLGLCALGVASRRRGGFSSGRQGALR